MKKLLLLLLLVTINVTAQGNPDKFRDGIKTPFTQYNELTTAEKLALPQVTGTVVYDTDLDKLQVFDGVNWVGYFNAALDTADDIIEGNTNKFITVYERAKLDDITNEGTVTIVGSATGDASIGTFNSFYGIESGFGSTGSGNSFYGRESGQNSNGGNNSFYGGLSGVGSTGNQNSFFGELSGQNSNGDNNSFYGRRSGFGSTGDANSFFGSSSGEDSNGNNNSFYGRRSGFGSTGSGNSFFGSSSGEDSNGGFSVFLGSLSGQYAIGNGITTIGANAGLFSIGNTLQTTNSTAIGANTIIDKANQAAIGDAAVTELKIGETLVIDKSQIVTGAEGVLVTRKVGNKTVVEVGAGVQGNSEMASTPFNPYKTITSTNGQDALEELKDELDASVIGIGTSAAPSKRTAVGGETNWDTGTNITNSHKLFVNGLKLVEDTDYTVSGSVYTFTGYTSISGHVQESFPDVAVPTTYDANEVAETAARVFVTPEEKALIGTGSAIEWKGAWISGNYTVDQAVSYNGSSYINILDTVSNEDPTNTTYWDVLVEKGDVGAQGPAGANGLDGLNAGLRYATLYGNNLFTNIDNRLTLDLVNKEIRVINFAHRIQLNNSFTSRYQGGTKTISFANLGTQSFWVFYLYYELSTGEFRIGQRSGGSTAGDVYDPNNTDHYLITSWENSAIVNLAANNASIRLIQAGKNNISKITILGDSHTNGGLVWVNEMIAKHGFINQVVRLGFDGSIIADISSSTFYDRRTQIAADTEILLIYGGTNDFDNSATVGTFKDGAPYQLNTTVGSLQGIIEYAYSINPKIHIGILTPVHHFTSSSGGTQLDVSPYTDGIKTVANFYNIPVLDLDEVMQINRFNYTEWFADSLHLNNISRLKKGKIVAEWLKDNF